MRTESKKLLSDVLTAARAIQEFNAGKSPADYQSNLMQRAATEREFEIIGEAMTRLRDTDAPILSQISEANLIIAFRNRLIHGYDTVDDEIVWEVIQHKLPTLIAEVESLLKPDS